MMKDLQKNIFITGATGYIGTRLLTTLADRNHKLYALVRKKTLSLECNSIIGDPLNSDSYNFALTGYDTFIHLVGVSHPNPFKKEQFRSVDYVSVKESIRAASNAGIEHFIYLSVAHPAPVMKEYIKVREECEQLIIESGLNATILRPWYVIGPGHRWPYLLIPIYNIFERIPATSGTARRLGLVTIKQMVNAIVWCVDNPLDGIRIIGVEEIKKINQS